MVGMPTPATHTSYHTNYQYQLPTHTHTSYPHQLPYQLPTPATSYPHQLPIPAAHTPPHQLQLPTPAAATHTSCSYPHRLPTPATHTVVGRALIVIRSSQSPHPIFLEEAHCPLTVVWLAGHLLPTYLPTYLSMSGQQSTATASSRYLITMQWLPWQPAV